MSWWVAPTLAAELWGVPLDRVLGRVDAGEVPSQTQNGALLIDVAPSPSVPAYDDADGLNHASPVVHAAVRPSPVVVPDDGSTDGALSADECSALFGGLADGASAADAPSVATAPSRPADPAPANFAELLAPQRTGVPPAAPAAAAAFAPPAAPVQAIGPSPRRPRRPPPGGRRPAAPAAPVADIGSPAPAPPRAPPPPAEPPRPAVPIATDDEDEMGPDPNYGEVDDGRPLDWRAARAKAATRRRPPPRFG